MVSISNNDDAIEAAVHVSLSYVFSIASKLKEYRILTKKVSKFIVLFGDVFEIRLSIDIIDDAGNMIIVSPDIYLFSEVI